MKKSIRVELEPQHLQLLDTYRSRTGAPRTETIRRAILYYFSVGPPLDQPPRSSRRMLRTHA